MKMNRLPLPLGALFALASAPALAASTEDTIALLTQLIGLICIAFVVFVAVSIYFFRAQDQRRSPLHRIVDPDDDLAFVGPEAMVSECVKLMAGREIGSLVVMQGGAILGIFTERDALKRVLAAGLDPARTRVDAVMTRNPVCIPLSTSVGEAMRLITEKRFRHLPVVEDGKLLGLVSSGDLTRWLVRENLQATQETVRFAVHPVSPPA